MAGSSGGLSIWSGVAFLLTVSIPVALGHRYGYPILATMGTALLTTLWSVHALYRAKSEQERLERQLILALQELAAASPNDERTSRSSSETANELREIELQRLNDELEVKQARLEQQEQEVQRQAAILKLRDEHLGKQQARLEAQRAQYDLEQQEQERILCVLQREHDKRQAAIEKLASSVAAARQKQLDELDRKTQANLQLQAVLQQRHDQLGSREASLLQLQLKLKEQGEYLDSRQAQRNETVAKLQATELELDRMQREYKQAQSTVDAQRSQLAQLRAQLFLQAKQAVKPNSSGELDGDDDMGACFPSSPTGVNQF